MKKYIKYFLLMVVFFSFSITLKLFIFEIYAIPSSSMENTLIPGDKVIVNKMLIGPRIPRSPFDIPWINLAFFLHKDSRKKMHEEWWGYKRLKGLSKIKRNDIIVFENSVKRDLIFIKRCTALPGDTILLINGAVYINGSRIENPPGIKMRYQVFARNYSLVDAYLDSLSFGRLQFLKNDTKSVVIAFLDKMQAELLNYSGYCDSVITYPETPQLATLPKSYLKNWEHNQTIDFFGPLVIPSKGLTINLNVENFHKYKRTIRNCEGRKIRMENNIIYIDNEKVYSYTFQYDYYFMMGDHRYNSKDSRYIGPVGENKIIGKTRRILYSNKKGKKFCRLLKELY